MAYGDGFWIKQRKRDALKKAEESGVVADSLEVRMDLIKSLESGEMTLEQVQAELKRIQKGAKRAGMKTRSSAYREG